MKKHFPKLLAASFAFFIGVVSSGNAPYESGRIHAYIDVARGQYQLQMYGPIDGDVEEFSKIASSDYGIEVVPNGCTMSDQGIEHARGYNDVSVAAIKRKYGAGIIDTIWQRAQIDYELKKELTKLAHAPKF